MCRRHLERKGTIMIMFTYQMKMFAYQASAFFMMIFMHLVFHQIFKQTKNCNVRGTIADLAITCPPFSVP